jgi:hypothetical protein
MERGTIFILLFLINITIKSKYLMNTFYFYLYSIFISIHFLFLNIYFILHFISCIDNFGDLIFFSFSISFIGLLS